MNPSIVTSIFTILLQLFIIFVYYLHETHVLNALVRVFVKEDLGTTQNEAICVEKIDNNLVVQKQDPIVSTPVDQKRKTNNDPFQVGKSASYGIPSLCSKFQRCDRLPFVDVSTNLSTIYRDYKKDRFPTAFSLIDRSHSWNAFDWNLWDFTQVRWAYLDHVLEVERTHSLPPNPNRKGGITGIEDKVGVFLIADENFDPQQQDSPTGNSNFLPELPFPEDFQRYSIRSDVFLWDFLNELLPNRTILVDPETNSPVLPPDVCRYYSTNYRVFESFTETENDTQWQMLQVIETLKQFNRSEIRSIAPTFNLLYPQCALQFRYNEYHVTKVQLQGVADYILIPLSSNRYAFPFPYNYPFKRQSQVNFHNVENAAKSVITDGSSSLKKEMIDTTLRNISSAYHVTLEKGQALIVPPGYFVYTEAKTLSMSLDILSPSKEQVSFYEILSVAIPCLLERSKIFIPPDEEEDPNRRKQRQASSESKHLYHNESIICTQVYIVHILSRINGIQNIQTYANNYYYSKYELLYSKQSLYMNNKHANQFHCYGNEPIFHKEVVRSLNRDLIETTAELIANKLNSPNVLSSSMKWLWLSNYIDSVLRKVYGSETSYGEIALFIKKCLDISGKLEIIEEVLGPPVMKIGEDTK